MTASLSGVFDLQAFTDLGTLGVGYRLYTYTSGTTTQKTAYTDAAGTVPHTYTSDGLGGQYIGLNARGELPAPLFLTSGAYDICLKTPAGATVWTRYAVGGDDVTNVAIASLTATLAGSAGSASVGFLQSGGGAGLRTLQDKNRERVSIADFLPAGVTPATATATQATTAAQAALNSGAKRIFVTSDYTINGGLTFAASNQKLDFDGGSFTVSSGTVAANGILYANGKTNIRVVDPIITAAIADILAGINFMDCPNSKVTEGTLTGCAIKLQSSSATTRMGYKVHETVVNMNGLISTAVYVSAAKGVTLVGVEMLNGSEGLGIYNGATGVREIACESYGHSGDGSVIINGQRISQIGNWHHDNGQSGFTTQRQTAATNCQDVTMVGNISTGHVADGFDLRGGNSANWNADMRLATVGNISYGNGGTGFFSIYAEGMTHIGNVAGANSVQGHSVTSSPRNIIIGMIASTNATSVGVTGTAKAGILFAVSASCSAIGNISGNWAGASQNYGISWTGACTDSCMIGGSYLNNATTFWNIDAASTVAVSSSPFNVTTGWWINYTNSQNGCADYSGVGSPNGVLSAVKGSVAHRTDGGTGEIYICNGGTSWTIR